VSDLPLTVADIAIFVVLGLSGLLAFFRGFIQEVLSVAAWVGAVAAVVFGLPIARPVARSLITEPLIADIVAGAVLFVLALIVLSLITGQIAQGVRSSSLNALDRSLGFAFGLVRGAFIVCLSYIAIVWLVPPPEQPAWIRDAKTLPLVEEGARWLRSLVPAEPVERAGANPTHEQMRRVLETERLVRDIISPEPRSADDGGTSGDEGYGERDRRELERLLGGETGREAGNR
jgi:membrane protein required for colicin V production